MSKSQHTQLKVHILSGTHWDREWRYTLEQSKVRLVHLIDSVIKILTEIPEYRCFHLDGGSIVLEDYLSINPENEANITALVKKGRIQLVPWYTLPDTFIVAPEALIRNLLIGHAVASRFGGHMKTGYTATSYGQNSQLPQIYKGFGLDTALLYRGTNKHQLPPIFKWQAKDGSQINVIRCFDEVTRTNWFFFVHQFLVLGKRPMDVSYTFNRNNWPIHMIDEELYRTDFQLLREEDSFLEDEKSISQAFSFLKNQALSQAIGQHILALNMEDNALPYAPLPRMVSRMNQVISEAEFVQNSVDEYVNEVLLEIQKYQHNMPTHSGELRYTAIEPGWNGLLGMTQSSRTKLKILNEDAETQLIYVAEPLASIASFKNWIYPHNILNNTWRALLQNHAHDSICGAAVDSVHEDMVVRFGTVKTVAQEISRRACEALYSNLNLTAFGKEDITLTIFNTLPISRSRIILLSVDLPGSCENPDADPFANVKSDLPERTSVANYDHFDIFDTAGNRIDYEIVSKDPTKMRVERELDAATEFQANRVRVLFRADVAPLGYRTYALRPRKPIYVPNPVPSPNHCLIAEPDGVLENEHLKLKLYSNGTFSLTDKSNGITLKDLHYFVDSGSVGSAHMDATPTRDLQISSLGSSANILLIENNCLRATFRVDIKMVIPSAATANASDRCNDSIELPITSWITLTKDSKRVEIRTRITNRARDHRLRVLFPSNINTNTVSVENAFAIDERNFLWKNTGDNMERHYQYQPMQNFIDLSNGQFGLAFIGKGLREYEIINDSRRTIAITLLRTHRKYMVATSNMIPDEMEKYTGLHSIGDQEYRYAIYPHKGNWIEGNVLSEAWDFKVPIRAIQGVWKEGSEAPDASFISIDDKRIMMSAFFQSNDKTSYILRFWNSSDQCVSCTMIINLPVTTLTKVRMDESIELEKVKFAEKKCKLSFRSGEIITLRLTK